MTEKDVELLNNYHKEVYEKISPYLEGDEKEWLKEATRPIPNKFFLYIKKPMFCACYFHRTSVFLISFPYNTFVKILSGAGAADLRRIPAAYSPPEYFPR